MRPQTLRKQWDINDSQCPGRRFLGRMAAKWIAASERTETRERETTINIMHFSISQKGRNDIWGWNRGRLFTKRGDYGKLFKTHSFPGISISIIPTSSFISFSLFLLPANATRRWRVGAGIGQEMIIGGSQLTRRGGQGVGCVLPETLGLLAK